MAQFLYAETEATILGFISLDDTKKPRIFVGMRASRAWLERGASGETWSVYGGVMHTAHGA